MRRTGARSATRGATWLTRDAVPALPTRVADRQRGRRQERLHDGEVDRVGHELVTLGPSRPVATPEEHDGQESGAIARRRSPPVTPSRTRKVQPQAAAITAGYAIQTVRAASGVPLDSTPRNPARKDGPFWSHRRPSVAFVPPLPMGQRRKHASPVNLWARLSTASAPNLWGAPVEWGKTAGLRDPSPSTCPDIQR
jgi:hypothetical protein